VTLILFSRVGFAQPSEPSPTEAVRVRVALNSDGSRTTYEFDNPHHKAIATMTAADGTMLGRIRYELDAVDRFSSGEVFGPDGKFRFKAVYKYDGAGRLEQEIQLNRDESVLRKFVYSYDRGGKRNGWSVYDGSGKLIATSATPTPTPRQRARK
jgi:hypothetical protein